MDTFAIDLPVTRRRESGGSIRIEGRALDSGTCELRVVDGRDGYHAGHPVDFFSALLDLRRQLERRGIQLLCQGARREVWPSAMARQMGQGLRAYVCEPGKPASVLVSIFEPAVASDCVTVAEQERYHEKWFESLGF